mmetsp:Transcript_2959/g.3494  ORF Transcript_2959/g.3494 Transcript_2959/m.3494 type:complete len:503 (+) Transcript_2959:28-1536(+)|eukprot:CAMPEP_0205825728 /NCGR_PEP_ID=MMETSP0206-20130828/26329_1 /ASSEMBLY_ACC=CAM_ASM_000279 /TAXON_ID=36767 /ORGANISM="Euplotes focardii, Strain TN1" /LENGTH=502 /DNA_ID=CAMNT_0053125025 /DNA_START=26 /DNA_END=1534 /DNA_ORIENTATION=+
MKASFTTIGAMVSGLALVLVGIIAGVSQSSPSSPQNWVSAPMREAADKLLKAGDEEGDELWQRLAELTDTFGPRFSGTTNLEEALDWIKSKAKKDNLTVHEELVMVPKWVRGAEHAKMLTPRVKQLSMTGLGMSNGTFGPDGKRGPVTAQVIVVRSFRELGNRSAEVKGKIVLFNMPWEGYGRTVAYRAQGARRAEQHGAVGCLIRSVAPFSMMSPHTGNSATANIAAAALSVEDAAQIARIVGRGQNVTVELYMAAYEEDEYVKSRNLWIDIVGHERPREIVLIGGHIDSWDNGDGAMDDGGGSLAAWHAIKMIHDAGLRPRRTIRAVLFTNEENGNNGGLTYARNQRNELHLYSMAIESDSGTFKPFRLGVSVSAAAFLILQSLGSLLDPIGSGGVLANGGSGVDIGPMCDTGVPCAALEVLDVRSGGEIGGSYKNNPCLGFSTKDDSERQATIAEGYFWWHHTDADTVDLIDPVQLQNTATSFAVWAFSIAELEDLLPR